MLFHVDEFKMFQTLTRKQVSNLFIQSSLLSRFVIQFVFFSHSNAPVNRFIILYMYTINLKCSCARNIFLFNLNASSVFFSQVCAYFLRCKQNECVSSVHFAPEIFIFLLHCDLIWCLRPQEDRIILCTAYRPQRQNTHHYKRVCVCMYKLPRGCQRYVCQRGENFECDLIFSCAPLIPSMIVRCCCSHIHHVTNSFHFSRGGYFSINEICLFNVRVFAFVFYWCCVIVFLYFSCCYIWCLLFVIHFAV